MSLVNLTKYNTVEASEEGRILYLLDPSTFVPVLDSDEKPLWIKLYGPDSKVYRTTVNRNNNKHIKSLQKKAGAMTTEELQAQALNLLIDCTAEWCPSMSFDGAMPLEFSKENARELYTTVPWIKDQAMDFSNDRANFMPNS